ncbi:unnamed protein product, partial [Prorocentrum cordatum]
FLALVLPHPGIQPRPPPFPVSCFAASSPPFAAGFLAMRFSSKAHKMWEVFQLYLFDQEEIKLHSSKSSTSTTIGTWLKQYLLNEDRYFTTILPRLPLTLKYEIGSRLLQITELSLGVEYQRNLEHIDLFSKPGVRPPSQAHSPACLLRLAWRPRWAARPFLAPTFR